MVVYENFIVMLWTDNSDWTLEFLTDNHYKTIYRPVRMSALPVGCVPTTIIKRLLPSQNWCSSCMYEPVRTAVLLLGCLNQSELSPLFLVGCIPACRTECSSSGCMNSCQNRMTIPAGCMNQSELSAPPAGWNCNSDKTLLINSCNSYVTIR